MECDITYLHGYFGVIVNWMRIFPIYRWCGKDFWLFECSLAYFITHILRSLCLLYFQNNKEESFWLANLTADA